MTSPGEVVIIFTYPYLSAGAPALGEAKELIGLCLSKKILENMDDDSENYSEDTEEIEE